LNSFYIIYFFKRI